jgi:hypothetical protein
MTTRIALLLIALSAGTLGACASKPAAPNPAVASTAVYLTGSHLPAPVDPVSGQAQGFAPMQTLSGQQLQDTGRTTVAGALSVLVPSATIH